MEKVMVAFVGWLFNTDADHKNITSGNTLTGACVLFVNENLNAYRCDTIKCYPLPSELFKLHVLCNSKRY